LRLPAGATDVFAPEMKDLDVYEEMLKAGRSESDIQPAYRGKRVKRWQVALKYPPDWQALIDHVERCLGQANFRSTTQAIGILAPQAMPTGGDQRMYVSQDDKTTVVLTRYPNKATFSKEFWHSSAEITEAEKNSPPYYLITVTQFSG
jgi:hypothetical protein